MTFLPHDGVYLGAQRPFHCVTFSLITAPGSC